MFVGVVLFGGIIPTPCIQDALGVDANTQKQMRTSRMQRERMRKFAKSIGVRLLGVGLWSGMAESASTLPHDAANIMNENVYTQTDLSFESQ